jgi:aminoglycoside phosphotransferase (APT) family kinase protein
MPSPELNALLACASRLTGRDLRLRQVLTGGQHAFTIQAGDAHGDVVVRVFPTGDDAVQREVDILTRVQALGGFVPTFLARGAVDDQPMIVTTLVPGTAPRPTVPVAQIAAQMGEMLARIHTLDGSGLRRAPTAPPDGTGVLARAARAALPRLEDNDKVLTHFDFWSGNTLWEGDELTGVVDWSGARVAPRGVDVAWCRQDLVLLGARSAADIFLETYENHAGLVVADMSLWDLVAAAQADPVVESWAANYHGVGRPDITSEVLRKRLDDWVRHLLET